MSTRGTVFLFEFWGCGSRAMRDGQEMATLLRRVSRKLGTEVVHSAYRRFDTGGIGGFSTFYDGHVAVRTFPEHGYAMVDLYLCGEGVDIDVISVFLKGLKAHTCAHREMERGLGEHQPPMLVLRVVPESGMMPPEVENDGCRDDVSGDAATPQGVDRHEHGAQLDDQDELEEPDRRPSAG